MVEFPGSFKLNVGLRAWGSRRNIPGLFQCYNVVPRVDTEAKSVKLEAYDPISVVSSIGTWPFPQLFCGKTYNFLCGETSIATLNEDFLQLRSDETSQATRWTLADFHTYVIFCDGSNIYVPVMSSPETLVPSGMPPTKPIIPYVGTNIPKMGCIENFKGQLIGCMVDGYNANEVVWGDIGSACMDPTTGSVEIGSAPMPWQGNTHTVKRLGDGIMVYGDGGGVMLIPAQDAFKTLQLPTFQIKEVFEIGIVAVGGDIHTHLVLDESGKLWKVSEGLKLSELGYQEWFEEMLGETIVICFDQQRRDFYIGDGRSSYILSDIGLAKIHQKVSSVEFYRGSKFGTCVSNGDTSMIVETDTMDFQLRGRKSIEWMGIQGKGEFKSYVSFCNDLQGTYRESPRFTVGPKGNVRAKVSGIDLRLGIYAESCVDVELEHISYGWKLDDKNFVRGAYASKAFA